MKLFILLFVVLLSCGGSGGTTTESGDPSDAIGIRVLRVDCDNDPRCTPEWVAVETTHRAIAYYQTQFNRKLELVSIETIPDPTPEKQMTLAEFNSNDWRFKYFQKYGKSSHDKVITLVIDKYIVDGKTNIAWAAGKSYKCTLYQKVISIVYSAYTVNNVSSTNITDLEKRIESMGIIIAHELGHALGAEHRDPPKYMCNFMTSWLCDLLGLKKPAEQDTIFDLNKCLARDKTTPDNNIIVDEAFQ